MTWGEYDGVSDPGEREPGQQRASVQSVGRSLESVAAGTTDGGFGAGVERELVGPAALRLDAFGMFTKI